MAGLIAHYRLESEIGRGGAGVVYRAIDTRLGRAVAIMVLHASLTSDAAVTRRFLEEARAASALNHPNIVAVHEIDSDAGVTFIAMELVEGTSLDQVIADGQLRFDHALDYARQIAAALAAAHAAGIVHRTIAPASIMVTRDGQVKVLDFGFGALGERTTYMSPEQAEGQAVDARSDIYSFGAVLYEMLTGRQALTGVTPAPLRSVRPDVPAVIGAIVGRCLSKDRKARYENGTALKRDLDAVAGSAMRWAHS
jgi:serine/threonine protein kinase